ncbi:KAP family P-loop NTPase fold protein [Aquabacterium sp.]|uniref:KAP family P-loop NTPase fold protein n=1 Tax=Aquabacterium sp. TaxID=1872578 RepID=UPI002E327685|nr:P-loop NTPase fold protein [Aquabacterium sp.]HEX5313123.1 P-loop NTPase fold protein [Aquabacterium sp.]
MWHDNETTVDYVNFRLVAKACAELIRDTGGEPISIGISGGWGAGKSSLVRMVASELSPEQATREKVEGAENSKYVVVTFNPWLYQGFEDARTALLQTVGDAVLEAAAQNAGLLEKAKSLVKRINFLRLAQLGGEVAATLITGVPVGLIGKLVEASADALKSESVKDGIAVAKDASEATKGLLNEAKPVSLPKEIQSFREALEDLLIELDITLVVFVDDLDRCLPKTAISTLEAIRLLLFLRRSAFVIAADDVFIRGAVRVHFAGTGLDDDVATNYFDKLIQVPLRVPRLGSNETKAYTALLFLERAHRSGQLDAMNFEKAKASVEARLRETWTGKAVDLAFLETLVPKGDTELLGLMGLAERLAPLLFSASTVQANPRLIKRFLNTVFLRKALAKPQNIDVDVQVLAKWHLLERCDENTANALAEKVSAESEGRVSILHDAEVASKDPESTLPSPFGDKSFVREWLQLEPLLGDMDMRPILHLSRDSTVRDFGADDLNTAGKALRDALVAARNSNETLKQQIRDAGEFQSGLAMARAWELRRSSRTWQKAEEVLMLVEVSRVHPSAGVRAAALVSQAPITQLAPGLVSALMDFDWMKDVLSKWEKDDQLPQPVKRAIENARKK